MITNHPFSLQQSSRRVHRGQDQTRPPAPPPHQNLQSQPARELAQQGTSQKKLQQSGQPNEDQAPPVPPHQSLRPEQQQHGREGEAVGGYQHPHQVQRPLPPPVHFLHSPVSPLQVMLLLCLSVSCENTACNILITD